MRKTDTLGIAIGLFAGFPVAALEPVACLAAEDVLVSLVLDEQNGLTSTVIIDVDIEAGITDAVYQIVDCESGNNIESRIDFLAPESEESFEAIKDNVHEFSLLEPQPGLDFLVQKLSDLGIETKQLPISSVQNCACAAYYPELLGDKQSYEVVQ